MSILNELSKYIEEAEQDVTPAEISDVENVGDAPVQTDDVIEINFGDLKDEVQDKIKELLMKEMKATDQVSENNMQSVLDKYSIFNGSVKEFKSTIGLENK